MPSYSRPGKKCDQSIALLACSARVYAPIDIGRESRLSTRGARSITGIRRLPMRIITHVDESFDRSSIVFVGRVRKRAQWVGAFRPS
jgi:hypothetical protein